MKLSDPKKDVFSAVGVGLLSMTLFVLFMGTVALWGQNAGKKVRSRLAPQGVERHETNHPPVPADSTVSGVSDTGLHKN